MSANASDEKASSGTDAAKAATDNSGKQVAIHSFGPPEVNGKKYTDVTVTENENDTQKVVSVLPTALPRFVFLNYLVRIEDAAEKGTPYHMVELKGGTVAHIVDFSWQ